MKQASLIGLLMALLVAGAAAQPAPGPERAAADTRQAGAAEKAQAVTLGSVQIGRRVLADGKPLPAGTYQIRVTAEEASPVPPGQTPRFERWAEFLQRGQVKGREVATIVPDEEIDQVVNGPRPRRGGHRVEMLKGGDYLRIWFNRAGSNYLIHLPPA